MINCPWVQSPIQTTEIQPEKPLAVLCDPTIFKSNPRINPGSTELRVMNKKVLQKFRESVTKR